MTLEFRKVYETSFVLGVPELRGYSLLLALRKWMKTEWSTNTRFIPVSEVIYFGMLNGAMTNRSVFYFILFRFRNSQRFTKHMTIFLRFWSDGTPKTEFHTLEIEGLRLRDFLLAPDPPLITPLVTSAFFCQVPGIQLTGLISSLCMAGSNVHHHWLHLP